MDAKQDVTDEEIVALIQQYKALPPPVRAAVRDIIDGHLRRSAASGLIDDTEPRSKH